MKAKPVDLDGTTVSPARIVSDYDIFEELYPQLRRFAAVVGMHMDPDDLVQDALVATIQRHSLADLEYPKAYLKRAIVNRAVSVQRRANRLRNLFPRLHENGEGTDFYPSDLAILGELDLIDRAIIFLADIEGLTLDLIAADLGLSHAACRKRASRARAQLRQLLSDEGNPT